MTIAIKRENNQVIFIDAVPQMSRQYTSPVTKNAIESGAYIADHVTIDNTVITVQGVVSDADFHTTRPIISPDDREEYGLKGATILNNEPVGSTPVIGGNVANKFAQFLPQSITQFTGSVRPTITFPEEGDRDDVDSRLSTVVEQALLEIRDKREKVTVLRFEKKGIIGKVTKAYANCIITSLSFEESADSGAALYPNITFEQIRETTLQKASLNGKVAKSVAGRAAKDSNKGKQTATKVESSGSVDVKDNPTEMSSELQKNAPLDKVLDKTKSVISSGFERIKGAFN